MSRYIDADVFKTFLEKQIKETEVDMRNSCGDENYEMAVGARECALREILSELKRVLIEDLQKVRHGYWIPSPDGINPIRCSKCNRPATFAAGENEFGDFEICRYPSSYCPECGAKMDGGKSDES